MSKVKLSQSEFDKLKVFADFVLFDEYQNKASYQQFERNMGIFFSGNGMSLETVFKDLCGPKKKYLTFARLIKSYLVYKVSPRKFTTETRKFLDELINKLIKTNEEEVASSQEENLRKFTSASSKNRTMLTKVLIIQNKEGTPRGIQFEYDDIFPAKLFDASEEGLYMESSLELDVLTDESKNSKDKELLKKVKPSTEYLVRDSISHIFGYYTNKIELLGFKTRCGKTYFLGTPKGEGFIYGQPMKQFHYLKFRLSADKNGGMTDFIPSFIDTPRMNESLKITIKDVNGTYIKSADVLINEEVALEKITNQEELDKYIVAAPIVSDEAHASEKTKAQNAECDLQRITKLEEKQHDLKDKDLEIIEQTKDMLTLDSILNGEEGGAGQKLRAGRGKSKGKQAKKEKDNKHPKRMKIPVKNSRKAQANMIIRDKKNYKDLMHKLNDNIFQDLDKEKQRLKNKRKAAKKLEEIAERHEEEGGKRLRAGRKKNSNSGQKSAGLFGGFSLGGLFGGDSTSSSSSKRGSSGGDIFSNAWNSVEDFFDSFGGADDDYYDQLDNMSNNDLMKMFYNNGPSTGYSITTNNSSSSSKKVGKNGFGYNYDYGYGYNQPSNAYSYGYNDNTSSNKKKQTTNKQAIKPDPAADKRAQGNWQKLKEGIAKNQGLHILQTIGAVIKAIVSLEKDESGEKTISINEKIRLYQILEENEGIVDFLSQARPYQPEPEPEPEEEEDDEEEELYGIEDLKTLDIDDVTARIQKIDELKRQVKNKDTLKKLDKVLEACIARKNEIIKEQEEKARQEMIKKQKLNEEEMKRKEEEKRKQAQEEKNKMLNNLLEEGKKVFMKEVEKKRKNRDNVGFQGQEIISGETKAKILKQEPNPKHSLRNQEISNAKTFKDPLFPPEQKTLCEVKGGRFVLPPDGLPEDIEGWEDYTWARAHEIFGHKKFKVFNVDDDKTDKSGAEIEDDDIIQGTLGDCYFLSAIAALSNQPLLIKRLFHTKDYRENGSYGVYYNVNGEWKMVVLDDYFPCVAKRLAKRWVFSTANGDEIWVMLLEKAWAKLNGSYARIGCGGQPHEVFEVTTEAYSERINIKKPSKTRGKAPMDDPFWEKLMRAQDDGYIMTAGTGCTDETEEAGLATGHAYTVTRLYDCFPTNEKKRVRLVNIRNPWGNGEWSGDYSDDSEKWTNELKREVQRINPNYVFEERDDGEFFMSYEDFCDYYVVMGICHIHLGYEYKTLKVSANKKRNRTNDNDDDISGRLVDRKSGVNGPAISKLIVTKDNCDCYIRICQKNMRYLPLDEQHHTKQVLEYIMILDSNFNYINSECNDEPTTCVRTQLNKGTYYLITDIHYRFIGHTHGYVISAYTQHPVELQTFEDKNIDIKKLIRNASAQLIKKFYSGEIPERDIDKTLLDNERQRGAKKSPESLGDGQLVIYSNLNVTYRVPFAIMHFENTTSGLAKIEMTLNKKGAKAFEVYCDETVRPDAEKFTLDIQPKSERTLLIDRYSNQASFGVSYGASIQSSGSSSGSSSRPSSSSTKKQDNVNEADVFNQEPEAIDRKGLINNYYMQTRDGFVLGIENKGTNNLNFRLELEGLKVSNGEYEGKSRFTFPLNKRTRKTFRTVVVGKSCAFTFTEV